MNTDNKIFSIFALDVFDLLLFCFRLQKKTKKIATKTKKPEPEELIPRVNHSARAMTPRKVVGF